MVFLSIDQYKRMPEIIIRISGILLYISYEKKLLFCIQTLYHNAIYNEGKSGHQSYSTEIIPYIVCITTRCLPFFA